MSDNIEITKTTTTTTQPLSTEYTSTTFVPFNTESIPISTPLPTPLSTPLPTPLPTFFTKVKKNKVKKVEKKIVDPSLPKKPRKKRQVKEIQSDNATSDSFSKPKKVKKIFVQVVDESDENHGQTISDYSSDKKDIDTQQKQQQQQQQQHETAIPVDALENKATEIGCFWSVEKPLALEAVDLLQKLVPFFTTDKLRQLIVPRSIKSLGYSKYYQVPDDLKTDINGISLRAIEWLVTNYSKGVKIMLVNEVLQQRVNIHSAYESQSTYFGRNLFDPFCRHDKIYFLWPLYSVSKQKEENVILLTTVGQLNFMKWAYEHGVLNYAQQHQHEIQTDMERTLSVVNKEKKQYKAQGKHRKRKELTKAPTFFCTVYSVATLLHFDHFDSPVNSPHTSPTHTSPTHTSTPHIFTPHTSTPHTSTPQVDHFSL
jgi:hypothetical protein